MRGAFFLEVTAPFTGFFSGPLRSFSQMRDFFSDLKQMRAKVHALEEEKVRLLNQWGDLKKITEENKDLRHLLQVIPDNISFLVTARILSQPANLYNRCLLVGAGSAHGVEKGMAVLSSAGVVGRVIEVDEKICRVLMVTDLNSRIPVVVEDSRDHAVLSGDNTDYPLLTYAQNINLLKLGSRILTSGYGGIFPPHLLVGTVSQIKNGVIQVRPSVEWDRLEFVSIVKFLPEAEEILKKSSVKYTSSH